MLGTQLRRHWERSFFSCVLVTSLSVGWVAQAAPTPTAPVVLETSSEKDKVTLHPVGTKMEVDTDLLAQIREGMKDTKCRDDLKKQSQAYDKELATLTGSTTSSAEQIRKLEWDLGKTRNKYLALVRRCGPCRTRKVSGWSGKSGGYWYGTDGSCLVENADPKALETGFDEASKSLRTRGEYLKFPHIVRVQTLSADEKSFETGGALLSDDFKAFLAIRTPLETEGDIQTFYYFIKNLITEGKEADGSKNFNISFSSYKQTTQKNSKNEDETKIELFSPEESLRLAFIGREKDKDGKEVVKEEFFYTTPGKRKLKVGLFPLDLVKGGWFMTPGSLRYSTYGLFIFGGAFVRENANDVLLEALLEMYRRAGGVTP